MDSNNPMTPEHIQSMRDRFDSQIEKVEKMYYGNGAGCKLVKNWLENDENKLFYNYTFPETFYELDPDKVKDFIEQEISLAIAQERKVHQEKLDELEKEIRDSGFVHDPDVYNMDGIFALVKDLIRQERITLLEGIKKELIEKKDMDHEANYGYGKEVVGLQDAISIVEKHLTTQH